MKMIAKNLLQREAKVNSLTRNGLMCPFYKRTSLVYYEGKLVQVLVIAGFLITLHFLSIR